jgi:hypothetical protein
MKLGKKLCRIQTFLVARSLEEIPPLVNAKAATPNRRFEFKKHSQFLIRSHNETLSVTAMRVSNEECSPAGIHGCDAAPTPTGFAEIVSDDFLQPLA